MAQFKLNDYIDVGTIGYHTGTSWKVTTDPAGNNIIDQSINDEVNLTSWSSPLPDGRGGYYSDLSELYLFVRVHIHNDVSKWYRAPVANQNDQMFNITNNGNIINTVNSLQAGIQ